MVRYECSEWQSVTGQWHVNCVKDLAGVSGLWWVPCRLLNIELTDYVILLKDKFNVNHMTYHADKDVLLFSWDKYMDAHRYLLWINAQARKGNWVC